MTRAFARCRSSPPQSSPVGRGCGASGNRIQASSVVSTAAVGTLDGVVRCRVVRDDTDVRRSLWVERSRIITRLCTDRLTALLTGTLTAVLTDELAGRFLRFGHHVVRLSQPALTATLTATLTDPGHSPVSGRARPGGGAWWAERWQGGFVGEPGADVVEELCRAGVVRGDLVGLGRCAGGGPRNGHDDGQDVGRSRHRGSFGGGPARGGRAPPPVGAVVERHRGDARPGRGADRDVLGHRRGASAPLRRMAGRSRSRVGAAPAFGVGHDPDDRAGGPVQRRRARRRRSGRSDPSRRAPPAGVVGRRLVCDSGTAAAVGGAGGEGRSAPAGAPRRAR